MANREPLAVDEWYHCYNRGIDKRKVFDSRSDYERFLLNMFVGNRNIPVHISNMKDRSLDSVLSDVNLKTSNPLVEIGAYSLMPNHFHFVLKEIQEGGIALFMQKVFTGYTMYFNKKNNRTGALFAGTFKSRHIADDRYLKHLISYVHLNPAELFDREWKSKEGDLAALEEFLRDYSYSSLADFAGSKRLQRRILGNEIFELFDKLPTMRQMVNQARTYEVLNI